MRIIAMLLAAIATVLPASAGLQPFPVKRPANVKEKDWNSASGKSTGNQDMRCVDGGLYFGGIDRRWFLVITGPPRNRFYYTFVSFDKKELKGTYKVKNGLAQFTGTMQTSPAFGKVRKDQIKSKPMRIGLNYRFVAKKVHFNILWRDGKGQYQYERKWFRQSGKKWLPREHHLLTYIEKERTAKRLDWQVKGEITRWKEDGQIKERQAIKHTAVYHIENAKYWRKDRDQPDWLPYILRPHAAEAQPECFHLGNQHFGWARGFDFGEPPLVKK